MTEKGTLPPPEELYRSVFDACRDKAALPLKTMLVFGVLAGIYIGLGGLFATVRWLKQMTFRLVPVRFLPVSFFCWGSHLFSLRVLIFLPEIR